MMMKNQPNGFYKVLRLTIPLATKIKAGWWRVRGKNQWIETQAVWERGGYHPPFLDWVGTSLGLLEAYTASVFLTPRPRGRRGTRGKASRNVSVSLLLTGGSLEKNSEFVSVMFFYYIFISIRKFSILLILVLKGSMQSKMLAETKNVFFEQRALMISLMFFSVLFYCHVYMSCIFNDFSRKKLIFDPRHNV